MASELKKGFCDGCGRERVFSRDLINHKLHFVLSIITGGLWLVSWLALVLNHRHGWWTCTECDTTKDLPHLTRKQQQNSTERRD